eukprot:CAMPEP_0178380280 /NCGR_PEP_ID=MMETSP0689_2-20121128/5380_1 /TAXON_ID=160604 /ORGANISM="Amphidinium massartii, Strain CS-259" /LENGTH=986 /DNA_ID=CAMNT_0020000415 /DNA_START=31 /DNA_END=2991 /DNA_ORIENTATION=-
MGAAVCCSRRSPGDFGLDEVPPDQIGLEVSQISALEAPPSQHSAGGASAENEVQSHGSKLGPSAAASHPPAGGSHWAKLRQSFHDGIGTRRSALKVLRRSQSRLSTNSTVTGRSTGAVSVQWGPPSTPYPGGASGPGGGGGGGAGGAGAGPRASDRRSLDGASGDDRLSLQSRIHAIHEATFSGDRLGSAEVQEASQRMSLLERVFLCCLLTCGTGRVAWAALRCFVVVASSTTVLLLVSTPDADMNGVIQGLAVLSTVSASILSALAKVPAEWSGMEDPSSFVSDRSESQKQHHIDGSERMDMTPDSAHHGLSWGEQTPGFFQSETQTDTSATAAPRRGRRTPDHDNYHSGSAWKRSEPSDGGSDVLQTRFSGEADVYEVAPTHRAPTSPAPRMHALARSASQTSLGLALAIKQQRAVLDSVAVQLEEAEEEVLLRGQMEEEQQELLRNFRRIVSREVGLVLDPPNTRVFVISKEDEERSALSTSCEEAKIRFRAFASIAGAKAAITQARDGLLSESLCGALGRPKRDWRASLRQIEDSVSVLFLSAAWLTEGGERREVPREWRADSFFIVLTCTEEELTDLTNLHIEDIPNPSDFEIREALREQQGVGEVLTSPIGSEDIRNAVMEALHQHFADQYLLLQQVGRGSFATVHKAKRMSDGQLFALKEVHLRRLGPLGVAAIDQEAQVLKAIQWPTLLFLVDTWVSSETRYFLMPLLTGGDLASKCEAVSKDKDDAGAKTMDGNLAIGWYLQTAHAIAYLHWRGMLHTDLKPANIMLAGNSVHVQVGDLGSALLLPGAPPHPALKNCVKGDVRTRLYTSPETMDDLAHSVSSDLWAIGATFLEIFTLKSIVEPAMDSSKMLQALKTAAIPEVLMKRLGAAERTFEGVAVVLAEEVKKQLVELLSLDPGRRPYAISLLQPHNLNQRLRNLLLEVGAIPDTHSDSLHNHDLQEMVADAQAAKHRQPPFQSDSPPQTRQGSSNGKRDKL